MIDELEKAWLVDGLSAQLQHLEDEPILRGVAPRKHVGLQSRYDMSSSTRLRTLAATVNVGVVERRACHAGGVAERQSHATAARRDAPKVRGDVSACRREARRKRDLKLQLGFELPSRGSVPAPHPASCRASCRRGLRPERSAYHRVEVPATDRPASYRGTWSRCPARAGAKQTCAASNVAKATRMPGRRPGA